MEHDQNREKLPWNFKKIFTILPWKGKTCYSVFLSEIYSVFIYLYIHLFIYAFMFYFIECLYIYMESLFLSMCLSPTEMNELSWPEFHIHFYNILYGSVCVYDKYYKLCQYIYYGSRMHLIEENFRVPFIFKRCQIVSFLRQEVWLLPVYSALRTGPWSCYYYWLIVLFKSCLNPFWTGISISEFYVYDLPT